MRARLLFLLPLAGLVLACAPLGKERPLTLKDLEVEAFPLENAPAAEVSRERALAQYREFLQASPTSPLRAEAMRRLADLQLEIGAERQQDEPLPAVEEDHAAAIALYLDLLDKFPARAGNDRVLYQLAKAYEENGEPGQALATLDRLIQEFPATPYRNEVQFRRAEMLFVRQRYEQAARAYEAVLAAGRDTPFHEQAVYKRGWSLFKQERFAQALEVFFSVLDDKLAAQGGGGSITLDALERADQTLVQDTLRVTSLSAAYLAGAGTLHEYLARGARRHYAYLAYDSLGSLYLDKERFNDAAMTYHAFADHYPLHGQAPLLQMQAIAAYRQGAFPTLVLQEKLDFARRYGLDQPYWRHHTMADQSQVRAYLRTTVDELARYYHAVAQRTDDADAYRQAVHWYGRYLAYFPGDAQAPAMNFLFAEALYESGRFREAAAQYERTAYDYPDHAQGSVAGYAAVLAYGKAPGVAGEGDEQRLQWQRRALASALRFADRYPDHGQAATVLAKAAGDYFALQDRVAAGVVAERLLREHPRAAAAQRLIAWKIIAFLAFDARDYARAEQAYGQVLALMPATDPARADMVESLASTIYKQGEQARASGDLAAAARHFLRVGQAAPGAAILAVAQYDGAAALLAREAWGQAIAVLQDFRKRYPRHDLQQDVTTKLAVAYLKSGQPVQAAREFVRIGKGSGDAGVRREATWRAAEMYEQAGLASKAAAAYKHYIQSFPAQFDQGMEARHKLALLNKQVGNMRRHRYWLNEIISADKGAGKGRTERSRYLAAQAALTLAEPSYQAFAKVRLVAPLEKNLKLKKHRMEQALSAYKQAADYGVAEVTTAATYKIAEIYHGLSQGLLESQRPRGLTEEELEEYDILLEEQAYPFEEQAISIHEVNVQRVAEGIYDDWVSASFEKLAGLLPVRYAKPEKSEKIVEVIY